MDLLTQQDLAQLKAKKQGVMAPQPTEPVDVRAKRYLILTLTGEFEKVHYPLPLNYLEDPGVEVLRRTLTRMQSQVDVMNKSGVWSEQLQSSSKRIQSMDGLQVIEQDNTFLRDQIEGIERVFAATHGEGFFNAAQDQLEIEQNFDQYRREAEEEIAKMANEVKSKEKELHQLQYDLSRIKNGTLASGFGMNQSVGAHSQADIEPVRN